VQLRIVRTQEEFGRGIDEPRVAVARERFHGLLFPSSRRILL
jgi:hypothetical protein